MTFPTDHAEATQLLLRAMRAPADVSEVSSDSGRTARIERSPEPGVDLAVRIDDAGWLVLSVTPVAERPTVYPTEIPFLPDRPATVVVIRDQVTVSWLGTEGFSCSMPLSIDPELSENLAEMARPYAERMKQRDPGVMAEVTQRIREFMASLGADARERFLASMAPDPDMMVRLESLFSAACEQTLAQGWSEVERKERSAGPMRVASAVYRRNRLRRDIALMPFGGAPSVLLRQYPDESAEPVSEP
jgi:hypothetical protein